MTLFYYFAAIRFLPSIKSKKHDRNRVFICEDSGSLL